MFLFILLLLCNSNIVGAFVSGFSVFFPYALYGQLIRTNGCIIRGSSIDNKHNNWRFVSSLPSSSSFSRRSMITPKTKLRRTAAIASTNNDDDDDGTTIHSLLLSFENRNLVSVKECLELYRNAFCNNQNGNKNDKNNETKGFAFIDGSFWHKGSLNGRELFEKGPRIPGSKFVDMDDIAARGDLFPELNPKNLPRMLPPKELFASLMDIYKIKNSDHIIIYGRKTVIFTPRTWFLFKTLGHDAKKIHLMQGSLEDWIDMGGDVERSPMSVITAREIMEGMKKKRGGNRYSYIARDPKDVCDMEEVLTAVNSNNDGSNDKTILIDPRTNSFHTNGHIPGSINIPYSMLLEKENSLKLRSRTELEEIFVNAGIDITGRKQEQKIIITCGTGVSVCHIYLALEECGRVIDSRNTIIYDGSWAEWGNDETTPKILPSKMK